jgi:hypothetical protein
LPFSTPPRERGLRKVSLAIAIAAGLAVFALGLWALRQPPQKPLDPVTVMRIERDRLLDQAPTPRTKVEALAKLVDRHSQDALNSARQDDAEKVQHLSHFYIELVRDDLPRYANELPPGQRGNVLIDVSKQLERTESALATCLASPAKLTNRTRANLEQMRLETRKSQQRLQEILQTG